MQYHGITIRWVQRPEDVAGSGGETLTIEQEPWPEDSAHGFYEWVVANGVELTADNLMDYIDQYNSQCDENGLCEVILYVRTVPINLPYNIEASYGELTEAVTEERDEIEAVTIELEDHYEPPNLRAAHTEVSAEWEGNVRNEYGTIISPPRIQLDGQFLRFGRIVFGRLLIRYTSAADRYILTLEPREGVPPENSAARYQSTVMAFWGAGQVTTHEIDTPPAKGNCGYGGYTEFEVNPDDENGDCYKLLNQEA